MESETARQLLREADRAEAAPWTDFPPTPRWYPPAVGLWTAAMVLVLGLVDDAAPLILALLAVEIGFVRWYTRYRGGVMPRGRAPREFRRAIVQVLIAIVLLLVVGYSLTVVTNAWVAAAVVFVGVTAVIAWYEVAYADAARRARDRLS